MTGLRAYLSTLAVLRAAEVAEELPPGSVAPLAVGAPRRTRSGSCGSGPCALLPSSALHVPQAQLDFCHSTPLKAGKARDGQRFISYEMCAAFSKGRGGDTLK